VHLVAGCWLAAGRIGAFYGMQDLVFSGSDQLNIHSEPAHTVSDIRRMDDPRRP
jgi:hypothetical protein